MQTQELAALLAAAKEAHTEYEASGPPPHDWAEWYASWILDRDEEVVLNVDERKLAFLLRSADSLHRNYANYQNWTLFYARYLLLSTDPNYREG